MAPNDNPVKPIARATDQYEFGVLIVDNLLNRTVRFQVGDVVHPRPVQVLMELFRQLNLEGEVVASTTDGDTAYLVVRVIGLSEAIIVPLAKTANFFKDDGAALATPVTVRG
jgi:hypothetical protein